MSLPNDCHQLVEQYAQLCVREATYAREVALLLRHLTGKQVDGDTLDTLQQFNRQVA